MTFDMFRHFPPKSRDYCRMADTVRSTASLVDARTQAPPAGHSALVIVVRRSSRAHGEATKWLGLGPDMTGSIVLALLLFAFVSMCYVAAKHFATWRGVRPPASAGRVTLVVLGPARPYYGRVSDETPRFARLWVAASFSCPSCCGAWIYAIHCARAVRWVGRGSLITYSTSGRPTAVRKLRTARGTITCP
jgi:hypothetical protein